VLLRLLLVRLPADCLVLHSCGATFRCWLLLAQCWLLTAGLRWCMCIVDNFIVMLVTIVTQHSSLFMPGFIHKICGGEL
jgi:hypothetical protein